MNATYLFYDIETTGLNKCFDQVLQFAAIRTDMEFNEIERHNIFVKLNPDVIPTPAAMLTHNISLTDLAGGLVEYEAIVKIHELMNTPGTISLGYNTLGFDDEFLRFSFYRNLLNPYTHQYANGCQRMDLYPMTVMFYLYKNEAINWPQIADKPSMRLEHLNALNNLVQGDAHDALVDVMATVALAKRFYKFSDMWRYLRGYFDKNADLERMAKLNEALIVDGGFGSANNYQVLALSLGAHNHYKNQTLWLRLDQEELLKTKPDAVDETTYVIRKKPGELYFLLPANERFMNFISAERQKVINENRIWWQKNPIISRAIIDYHKEYKYPVLPNVDVDAALYQVGFLSFEDERQCVRWHKSSILEKAQMIDQFTNSRLRHQALRILGRNYPQHLPENYLQEYVDYLAALNVSGAIDYKGGKKFTSTDAQAEIEKLQATGELTTRQLQLLQELNEYLAKHTQF